MVLGLGMALGPLALALALLELFLLLPFLNLTRWKFFIKLACAGEKLLDHMAVGLAVLGLNGVGADRWLSLCACGVA